MIAALTKIRCGGDAVLIGSGAAGQIDASVTIVPKTGRPFIHEWNIEEAGNERFIRIELHWPSTPRGAA